MTTGDASPGIRRCATCDYDLTGTVVVEGPDDALCPECGAAISGSGVAAARERRTLRRVLHVVVVLVAVLVAVSATVLVVVPDWAPWLLPMLFFLVAPVAPVMLAAISGRES